MERLGADGDGLVEGRDSWKDLALQELERGTASGGNVGHLLGNTGLLDGGNLIPSAAPKPATTAAPRPTRESWRECSTR